ncbi:MAG: histidinol-phosphate transaminase [Pseudomonadota bacterium]
MSAIVNRARKNILGIKAYQSARSLYKAKANAVFLDANECAYEPYIGAEKFSRYPEQQAPELQDVLCREYDVSSRNLLISRGADEAIDLLVRSFCEPKQDNIIICPPTFPMYAQAAIIQEAAVKKVPLTADFLLDMKGLKKSVDKNTKIIFICSPNNPTGNTMREDDIYALCEAYKDQCLIVVDETYAEFTDQQNFIPDIDRFGNLVVLRTLSKSFAAAGLRCGVAIGAADIIELLRKVLPPYPLPQPVVQAGVKIFEKDNYARLMKNRADVLARKESFMESLENLPSVERIYPSDANFILVKFKDAQEIMARCLDNNIIVRDQSYQDGLENCMRIAIGSEEEIEKLLLVLEGKNLEKINNTRRVTVTRQTKETSIAVTVDLDQTSPVIIDTGVPFYDHMLEQIAKHGGFSLSLECSGDLDIEAHHTVEDCAIALGQAIKEALGNKQGIGRYGSAEMIVPMDEAQAKIALDLGGRFYLRFNADYPDRYVGNVDNPLPVDMVEHVFRSLAENLQATLHIDVKGDNTHHMVEICFKAFGRAFRQAKNIDGDDMPSTKGVL